MATVLQARLLLERQQSALGVGIKSHLALIVWHVLLCIFNRCTYIEGHFYNQCTYSYHEKHHRPTASWQSAKSDQNLSSRSRHLQASCSRGNHEALTLKHPLNAEERARLDWTTAHARVHSVCACVVVPCLQFCHRPGEMHANFASRF